RVDNAALRSRRTSAAQRDYVAGNRWIKDQLDLMIRLCGNNVGIEDLRQARQGKHVELNLGGPLTERDHGTVRSEVPAEGEAGCQRARNIDLSDTRGNRDSLPLRVAIADVGVIAW